MSEKILYIIFKTYAIVAQIMAPILTLIFIFVNLFTNFDYILIFNIFCIIYLIGLFTSTVVERSQFLDFMKTELERKHPWIFVLITLFKRFALPIFISIVYCAVKSDFSLLLFLMIVLDWSKIVVKKIYHFFRRRNF